LGLKFICVGYLQLSFFKSELKMAAPDVDCTQRWWSTWSSKEDNQRY